MDNLATPEDLATMGSAVRSMRDTLLSHSDWTQLPDAPLTAEQMAAWRAHRQELRDIPRQARFPESVDWPVKPT